MSRRSVFAFLLLLTMSVSIAKAQTESSLPSEVRQGVLGTDNELARSEQELAGRLVELRKAQTAENFQRQVVESQTKQLEAAKQSGDPTSVATADATLRESKQLLVRCIEQTTSTHQLHTQAKMKFDLARRKQELASAKGDPNGGGSDKPKAPFEDVLKWRTQVEQATQEAELAQKQTRTLRDQLQTMLLRQKDLRGINDDFGRKLNAQTEASPEQRQQLWNERQVYVESLRKITDEIQQVREEILLAEATERIKEDAATEAKSAYVRWKTSLILSAVLIGAALLLVLLARVVLARLVHEPERRYTANKVFSLATTLIVVFGMMFIFADQFASILTLLGFAVAGLAIALQEIVSSFAAWFFVRGSRGYTTRDWVQIGSDFGEVVDVSFTRTTLQQFQPLSTDGKPSGANPTGGLIVLMNNAVFKHTLVNFTRGYPFVWCSLTYNVMFESNWERGREILQEAMLAENEIVDTARRAKKNISEMSSSFHIRVPSTEPVVRTWVSGVGVELTLRFLAHPRSRPELLDRVNLRVLRAIQQSDDIRFAYWTVRSIAAPVKEEEVTQSSVQDNQPDREPAVNRRQRPRRNESLAARQPAQSHRAGNSA